MHWMRRGFGAAVFRRVKVRMRAWGTVLVLTSSGLLALGVEANPDADYTLAIYPFGSSDKIYTAVTPLVDYLSERLDHPVRLIVTHDYQELADRVAQGGVDLAWIGSANYVQTFKTDPDLQYIATYRERSKSGDKVQTYYQAVILTLESAPYKTLQDLRGTRFGFTDPDSTSGNAFPRMMLRERQIDVERFFDSTYFLGTHPNVIKALKTGSIHAGAVSDGTYYNAIDAGEALRVLAWSDPIPLDAVVARAGLPDATVESVRRALLEIGPDDHPVNRSIREVLGWPAAGFAVSGKAFYRPLADALASTSDTGDTEPQ